MNNNIEVLKENIINEMFYNRKFREVKYMCKYLLERNPHSEFAVNKLIELAELSIKNKHYSRAFSCYTNILDLVNTTHDLATKGLLKLSELYFFSHNKSIKYSASGLNHILTYNNKNEQALNMVVNFINILIDEKKEKSVVLMYLYMTLIQHVNYENEQVINALYTVGDCYISNNNFLFKYASSIFLKVLKLRPNDVYSITKLKEIATIYFNKEGISDSDEVFELCIEILKHQPEDTFAIDLLGKLKEKITRINYEIIKENI